MRVNTRTARSESGAHGAARRAGVIAVGKNWKSCGHIALTWLGAFAASVLLAAATLAAILYVFSRGCAVPARHLMWGACAALVALAFARMLSRPPMRASFVAAAALLGFVGVVCERIRGASLPWEGDPHEGRAVLVLSAELSADAGTSPIYHAHRVWFRPCRAQLRHRDLDANCPDGRPGVFRERDVEPPTTDLTVALGYAPPRPLAISVHGVGVKEAEGAVRMATALDDAGVRGDAAPVVLAVLWPTQTYPQEYRMDAARARSPELAGGLAAVLRALPPSRQHEATVVAHSAGNVLLAGALKRPGVRGGLHVRTTISLNSDLPLDEVTDYLGNLGEVADQVDLFVDAGDLSLQVSSILNGLTSLQPRAGQISRAGAEAAVRALSSGGRLAPHVRMVLHMMDDATVSADDGMRHGQFWSSASVAACLGELVTARGRCLDQGNAVLVAGLPGGAR